MEEKKLTDEQKSMYELNVYRNRYYAEPQGTEKAIIANAINDLFNVINCLHERNAGLNDKNATLEYENSELKQRVSILEADNDDYKNKIAENELVSIDWHYSQVGHLEEEIERLAMCLQTLETVLKEKEELLEKGVEEAYADFMRRYRSLEDDKKTLIEINVELETQVEEYQDKIEQKKIISPKFSRNQEVYYIEYVTHAYPCPHCGEECYEEKVKGVAKGIICERIITDNQDGMDIWYTIQIEEKGKLKMFTKREEKEVFLTREEAEKRLKELQNG